jgi:putative MATE family efflux protein
MAVAFLTVVVRGARREGAALRPDLAGIRAAGRSGVPLIVRTLTLRAALLLMTYVAAAAGTVAIAAHQVAFTIWSFLALMLDAVAIAGQAIVGRYLGAADVTGTRASTRRMVEWGLASGVLLGVVLLTVRAVFVPLFTDDPAVRALLSTVLVVAAVGQPVCGVVFVLDGVLIGAGDGGYLAKAGIVTLLCFAPLALLVLWQDGGLVWLWWAFNGFLVARLVTLVLRWRGEAWLVTGAAMPRR